MQALRSAGRKLVLQRLQEEVAQEEPAERVLHAAHLLEQVAEHRRDVAVLLPHLGCK